MAAAEHNAPNTPLRAAARCDRASSFTHNMTVA
jgi:hypothetical protein